MATLGRMELQLGAGLTPFSRAGETGVLYCVSIREYLHVQPGACTGNSKHQSIMPGHLDQYISCEQPEKSGDCDLRRAKLHNFLASFRNTGSLQTANTSISKTLADHCLRTHFSLSCYLKPLPYYAMLKQVVIDTAKLMAHRQAVGFCMASDHRQYVLF